MDGLPEGQHGEPQSNVGRCIRPSEMEKTDSRFKAGPVMGKSQDEEELNIVIGKSNIQYNVCKL